MRTTLILALLGLLLVPAAAGAQAGGTTSTTPATPTVPATAGSGEAAPTSDQVASAVAYLKARRGATGTASTTSSRPAAAHARPSR